jgi:hypothetical protein
MIMIFFFLFVIALELLVFGYLPFGFLSLSVPTVFSRVFIGMVTFDVNCYTTATLFWLYMPRRSLFFHWCCCWVVVQHCTHTHKYYRGLVCVCICRTRADSLCCVRDDDQGRCSDTDRYMSPHSTFLFSLCHLLFYFLFLLLLPFFPLSLGYM